ncbi:MAG: type II toxin-antitoxin system Phd/YefM family antitoxin [Patescibacteria group bacterium]
MNFTKIQKTVGVSDFRASIPAYLKQAKENPVIISANRGEDPFVLLSADAYNKLVEARELEIDSRELAKLIKEDNGKEIPWEKIRRSK